MEKRADFRQAVEGAAPPGVPPDAISAAVRHLTEKTEKAAGVLNPAAVRDCVELAGSFAEFRKNTAPEGGFLPALSRSPLAELTERQTLAAVEDSVRQVREEVFGAPEAPFSPQDYPAAIEWLEAEDKRTRKPPAPEERERLREIDEQISALMHEASVITGSMHSHQRKRVRVHYWRPGAEGAGSVAAGRDRPKLNALVRGAVQIAEATGFSQCGVLAYLLADVPPMLPGVRVTSSEQGRQLPAGGSLLRRFLAIEIETASPSEDDLREILRAVRAHRTETPENEGLRRLLQEAGGVPVHPPRSFWESVSGRWQEAGFTNGSPDALRMRFQRLPEVERVQLRRSA